MQVSRGKVKLCDTILFQLNVHGVIQCGALYYYTVCVRVPNVLKSWFNPQIKLINLFRETEKSYSIERCRIP